LRSTGIIISAAPLTYLMAEHHRLDPGSSRQLADGLWNALNVGSFSCLDDTTNDEKVSRIFMWEGDARDSPSAMQLLRYVIVLGNNIELARSPLQA